MAVIFIFSACTTPPPKEVSNVCQIFYQYPKWYWAGEEVQRKWGLPVNVLMAIIYQESKFRAVIKPPREKLLGFIPWFRPTSAFGYAQVLDDTWRMYQKDTGNISGNRDDFFDAVDFIGWYAKQAHAQLGISEKNAYEVYLAYHEGIGGYERKTYLKKEWLMKVAHKVQHNAWIYHVQLEGCRSKLPKRPWWHFWSYI